MTCFNYNTSSGLDKNTQRTDTRPEKHKEYKGENIRAQNEEQERREGEQ